MASKDWTGNAAGVFKTIGASNHTQEQREVNDYYATDPEAVEILLQHETFSPYIWEPACGEGHISEVLKKAGYKVRSSDLINRNYEGAEVLDFLQASPDKMASDIVTNPPYKYAKEFVEQALNISMDSTKIAMLLKLTFLEGQARWKLFEKNPPKRVLVFSKRTVCAKNGDFKKQSSGALAYAWFIWEKGFKGDPVIKWINHGETDTWMQ